MNGTALILGSLYGGEIGLAEGLLAAAARHRDEPEIRHVAIDLARWSRDHATRLADAARNRGLNELAPQTALRHTPALIHDSSEEAPARDAGLLLLRDLLDLNAAADANAVYWDILTVLAKAIKDEELLEMANDCGPQAQRQAAWTRSMLKTTSPQVLTIMNR